MAFVAKKIFLTKGVGKHRERLSSFELALRNAGIAACNIVRVSSIFPPYCKLISRSEGLKHFKPGQVAFTVISENQTREPHRLIAAGVGLALPGDKSMFGYLSEHHSFGETEEVAGEYAEELAAEMLATTLNVEFDPDLSWDEKKEVYRISNKIVRTMNITQSAVGDKRGLVDHGARRRHPSRRRRLILSPFLSPNKNSTEFRILSNFAWAHFPTERVTQLPRSTLPLLWDAKCKQRGSPRELRLYGSSRVRRTSVRGRG